MGFEPTTFCMAKRLETHRVRLGAVLRPTAHAAKLAHIERTEPTGVLALYDPEVSEQTLNARRFGF